MGDYWYPARKITVRGEVGWPDAVVSFEESNGRRVVTGNALPVGHPTGTFPIRSNDPAYQIDRNPNADISSISLMGLCARQKGGQSSCVISTPIAIGTCFVSSQST